MCECLLGTYHTNYLDTHTFQPTLKIVSYNTFILLYHTNIPPSYQMPFLCPDPANWPSARKSCVMTSCHTCSLTFISNQRCIACDQCDTWYHLNCTKLTDSEFQAHCENSHLPWTCSNCEANTHCSK